MARARDAIVVLASASPRRLDLMRQVGLDPDIVDAPEVDESVRLREPARDYVKRMAVAKLDRVSPRHAGAWVIAADTVVACGRRILPKAETAETAGDCLRLLSGRRHRVWGAIAVRAPDGRCAVRVTATSVTVKRLSDRELSRYLAGGEWKGKAGGYAIQGMAASFIRSINGSYSNVVGLSLSDLADMLNGMGWTW